MTLKQTLDLQALRLVFMKWSEPTSQPYPEQDYSAIRHIVVGRGLFFRKQRFFS